MAYWHTARPSNDTWPSNSEIHQAIRLLNLVALGIPHCPKNRLEMESLRMGQLVVTHPHLARDCKKSQLVYRFTTANNRGCILRFLLGFGPCQSIWGFHVFDQHTHIIVLIIVPLWSRTIAIDLRGCTSMLSHRALPTNPNAKPNRTSLSTSTRMKSFHKQVFINSHNKWP